MKQYKLQPDKYDLMTLHRQSNANVTTLQSVFSNIEDSGQIVVYPVHPRTRKIIDQNNLIIPTNLILIEPVSYMEMMGLVSQCRQVFTDSGGLQKEAYEWKKPCLTMRETTEWTETFSNGWNRLINPNDNTLLTYLNNPVKPLLYEKLYPDQSGVKTVEHLIQFLTMIGR
jgi:UDP-GlcNAc3NAcA epimerase